MKKRLSKIVTLSFLAIFIGLMFVGCSDTKKVDAPEPSPADKIELSVYLNGPDIGDVKLPIVPVKREISLAEEDTTKLRVKAAVEELIKGPNNQEKKEGLTTSIPEDVKLLNVEVKRPYVTVDFSTELQYIGGTMKVSSLLDQIAYTLTEIDGVAGVIMQVDGEQVGTETNPFSGDGFLFDVLSRPVEGEWIKEISPARALDNFIVSIGNAQEMWKWMSSEAKEYYKNPEGLPVSDFAEGLGSWRDYKIVTEDIQGDKAVVVIMGDQVLEGMAEKNARYTAYMIKEDGQWKWELRK